MLLGLGLGLRATCRLLRVCDSKSTTGGASPLADLR